jgi:hypothetical protein
VCCTSPEQRRLGRWELLPVTGSGGVRASYQSCCPPLGVMTREPRRVPSPRWVQLRTCSPAAAAASACGGYLPLGPSYPSPAAASWTCPPGAQVKVGVRGSDLLVCSSTSDPADGFGLRSFLPNRDFFRFYMHRCEARRCFLG